MSRGSNDSWREGSSLTFLDWFLPNCISTIGFEISALSILVDAPAEAIWLWLHDYASNQAQRPHDFPRGTRHESIHWCGRRGIKSCNGVCFLHAVIVFWKATPFFSFCFFLLFFFGCLSHAEYHPQDVFPHIQSSHHLLPIFLYAFQQMKLRIHLAAFMWFNHVLHVICYRSRLRRRAAPIVGQRMRVVATVTRWATIFLQTIVWMKAFVWIAPTMQTGCWSQRYIFLPAYCTEIVLASFFVSFLLGGMSLFWSKKFPRQKACFFILVKN